MFKTIRREKSKPKQALQEAIGFTLEDLQINETGALSSAQLQSLKQDFMRWFLSNLAITAAYLFIYNAYQSGTKTYNEIGTLILISLVLLPLFLFTLNNWVRVALDWLNGKVSCVEGTIELDIVFRKGNPHYKLISQGVIFEPSKAVFLSFKNNEPYVIYFVPYSKTIMSAAWLRS